MVGKRVVVCGHVQGVGFRHFVHSLARELEICGWVKNLATGEVEVLATGEPQELIQFLSSLRRGPPSSRVTEVKIEEITLEAAPKDFRVVY